MALSGGSPEGAGNLKIGDVVLLYCKKFITAHESGEESGFILADLSGQVTMQNINYVHCSFTII